MKRYTVWTRKPRRFDTLEAAREYASAYFDRTGVIVAITSKA